MPVPIVSSILGVEKWNRFNIVVNREDILVNRVTLNVAFLDYQNKLYSFSLLEEIFTYRDTLNNETNL